MLLVVALVLGVASSVGAQVDPVFPTARAVWAAGCVAPSGSELVVYGRGWASGPVALEVTDEAGAAVGGASTTAADRPGGAVFQGRVPVSVPADASALRLVASQAGATAEHRIAVSGSCSPSITAVIDAIPCALPGRPVNVTVTVRGAPTSAYDLLLHHADLYGPAEAVDRSQPRRPAGEYAFPLTVPNVPDRLVPVTVEARRRNGSFAYATTYVALPPTCSQPTTPTTGAPAPGTTAPPTVPPSSAATTTPASPGATTPLLPSPGTPLPAGRPSGSLVLSPALGQSGGVTTVFGRGFAPSTAVTLRWRPGIGQWAVTAAIDGSFRTQVLVLPKDVEGPRVLEVVGGGAAAAPYLVVPDSDQPAFGGVFVRS